MASLWLLPAQFNVLLPSTTLNHTQVSTILKQVSYTSGAEVVFKGMSFEMHGLEHEVRTAVSMLLELDIVKVEPQPFARLSSLKFSARRSIMRFGSRSSLRTSTESSSVGKRTARLTRSCRPPMSRSNSRRSTSITS